MNAITKSGTNVSAGTASALLPARPASMPSIPSPDTFFLNSNGRRLPLPLADRVRRDRLHFFGYYQYEREPQDASRIRHPFPSFNVDLQGTRVGHTPGGRVDYQHSLATRLAIRIGTASREVPYEEGTAGGAERHPSAGQSRPFETQTGLATLTNVLSNRAVNEFRTGFFRYETRLVSPITWDNHPAKERLGVTSGTPRINFQGFSIGQDSTNAPTHSGQKHLQLKNDFMYSATKAGRHDFTFGGEYGYMRMFLGNCRQCMGILDANNGPIPANIQALFPVWDDPDSWNLAPLSSISRRFRIGITDEMYTYVPRHIAAGWIQDNWAVNNRLTLNLGVRYDLQTGVFAQETEILPWVRGGRSEDKNDIAPRLGFVYTLNDRTAVRGGFGKYFGEVTDQIAHGSPAWTRTFTVEVLNDGRPNFASNPFNGPLPSVDQVRATLCENNGRRSRLRSPRHQQQPGEQRSAGALQLSGINRLPAAAGEHDGVRG